MNSRDSTNNQYHGLICCAIEKLIADTTKHGLPSILIARLTTSKPMKAGVFVYDFSLTSPASDLDTLCTNNLARRLDNAQVPASHLKGFFIG